MTIDSAYQTGMLDVLRRRESLASVLFAAGEKRLLLAYVRGRLAAVLLMRDHGEGEDIDAYPLNVVWND